MKVSILVATLFLHLESSTAFGIPPLKATFAHSTTTRLPYAIVYPDDDDGPKAADDPHAAAPKKVPTAKAPPKEITDVNEGNIPNNAGPGSLEGYAAYDKMEDANNSFDADSFEDSYHKKLSGGAGMADRDSMFDL
jgi:hypothetical protein